MQSITIGFIIYHTNFLSSTYLLKSSAHKFYAEELFVLLSNGGEIKMTLLVIITPSGLKYKHHNTKTHRSKNTLKM